MILALALAVVLAVMSAIAWRLRSDVIEAQSEAFDAAWTRDVALGDKDRAMAALRALLVPLGWTYEMVMDQADVHPEFVARLRVYLHAIYGDVQGGLFATDVEMAEHRDAAALMDPPRRLPRYPQVPPYLATVEDVAGVPSISKPMTPEQGEEFARQWREADEAGGRGRSMILGDGAEHFDPHGTPIEALDARQEEATDALLEQAARDAAQVAPRINADVAAAERSLAPVDGSVTAEDEYQIVYQDEEGRPSAFVVPVWHGLATAFSEGRAWADILGLEHDARTPFQTAIPVVLPEGQTRLSIRSQTEENHWWGFDVVRVEGGVSIVQAQPRIVQRVVDGLSAEGDLDQWTKEGTERLLRAVLRPDAGEVDAVVIECDNGHRFTEVPLAETVLTFDPSDMPDEDHLADALVASVKDQVAEGIRAAGWPCPECGQMMRAIG